MRIGWVADNPGFMGGAERNVKVLADAAPEGVEIVPCRPGADWPDVDMFVVHNCVHYDVRDVHQLQRAPVVKAAYDLWKDGDMRLRAWIAEHAVAVVMVSPMQREWIDWRLDAPIEYVPSAVDLAPFKAARADAKAGNVWIGRLERGKGLHAALAWAQTQGEPLDVYGFGRLAKDLEGEPWYRGMLEHTAVPPVLGAAKRFVFLPQQPDPCPRSVIEAWAAGCELVLNGNVGTLWWLENEPEALENAAERFWEVIERYGP